MAESKFAKFIKKGVMTDPTPHPEVTAPRLGLKSGGGFGNTNFSMSWWAITEPFVMVTDCHKHDFDQFIIFAEETSPICPIWAASWSSALARTGRT